MQYRLHVYGRIYRKGAFLDTRMTKETSLDQLVEKEREIFRFVQSCFSSLGCRGLTPEQAATLLPQQGAQKIM